MTAVVLIDDHVISSDHVSEDCWFVGVYPILILRMPGLDLLTL